jgi:hypothetical protein
MQVIHRNVHAFSKRCIKALATVLLPKAGVPIVKKIGFTDSTPHGLEHDSLLVWLEMVLLE